MALQKAEIKTYFGQCRCCLGYAYLKNMWQEHLIEGEREVYGKMLVDCFSITWTIRDKVDSDRICENCISRLRDAFDFKNEVLKSQGELLQEGKATDHTSLEITNENTDLESETSYDDQKTYKDEVSDEDQKNYKNEALDEEQKTYKNEDSDEEQKAYENVEFLEEEVLEEFDKNDDSQDSQPKVKKRKCPPMYRQYSDDDLNTAIEAVKERGMSFMQASKTFNIPRKTIVKKARNAEKVSESIERKKMNEFINGVKAILTHTNATPFRRKVNSYFCFFCPLKSHAIETPEELRKHTHSVHWDKVTRVDFAMRPPHSNLTVRIDIENITCKNCDTEASWEDMLDHLEVEHGVDLEETRNRLVPYRLEENEMTCVLCDFKSSFPNMDSHMNSHFKNYICGECGDSFITAARLFRHSKTHKLGVFPCTVCDKIFTRELYRRKHTDIVHKKKLLFKCVHCDERFPTDGLRTNHVKDRHFEKLQSKSKTCKECNKSFLPVAYYQHMRLHSEIHACDECGKSFTTQKLLEEHRFRHAGVKNFKCDVCFKPYFSQQAVYMHKKYKHK